MEAAAERKATRELRVFEGFVEFAAARGLRVRPGSADNRAPPEPDILCEVEGEGPVAFELVQIVDSDLAEDISVSIRDGTSPLGEWVAETMEKITKKVETRAYVTPHPMELVAWGNPFITPPSVWIPTFEEALKALHGRSRFRRIWVVNLGGPDDERGVWFVDPPVSGGGR